MPAASPSKSMATDAQGLDDPYYGNGHTLSGVPHAPVIGKPRLRRRGMGAIVFGASKPRSLYRDSTPDATRPAVNLFAAAGKMVLLTRPPLRPMVKEDTTERIPPWPRLLPLTP